MVATTFKADNSSDSMEDEKVSGNLSVRKNNIP